MQLFFLLGRRGRRPFFNGGGRCTLFLFLGQKGCDLPSFLDTNSSCSEKLRIIDKWGTYSIKEAGGPEKSHKGGVRGAPFCLPLANQICRSNLRSCQARPKTVCKQWKKHPTKYTKYFHSFTPAAKVFSIPCWDYLCASTQNSFLSWLRDFLRLFIMITIPRSQHNTFHVRSFSLYLKLTCRFPINTIFPSPLTFQNSRVHGGKRTKYQIKISSKSTFFPRDFCHNL